MTSGPPPVRTDASGSWHAVSVTSRSSDPVLRRLARHGIGIGVLVVAALALGVAGAYPTDVPWWLVTALLLLGSVVIAVAYTVFSGDTPGHRHVRAAAHAGALAAVTYPSGWGFVLPFVHLFGIADSIDENGPDASRAAIGWAVFWTVAGQVGVELGLIPLAAVDATTSHALAVVSLALLVLIAQRLRSAAADRALAHSELERSEARFRRLVEDAGDVILLVDDRWRVGFVSSSADRILGDDVVRSGDTYLDLVHPEDRIPLERRLERLLWHGESIGLVELRLRARDGWIEAEASHRDLREDPAVDGIVVSLRDIGERNQLAAELERRLHDDPVTGLLNRDGLAARLRLLAQAGSRPGGLSVLAVQADGVGDVGDAGGQQAIDDVLRGIATRLTSTVAEDDVVARTGDTRFGVVVTGPNDDVTIRRLAERLQWACGATVTTEVGTVRPRITVGAATLTAADDVADLPRSAEVALRAGLASGDAVTVFDESMLVELERRAMLERELPGAIISGQLRLLYQPLWALGRPDERPTLTGAEALVRWEHPIHGLLGPDAFVPIAEDTGLASELGWWVLEAALEQLVRWDEQDGHDGLPYVSVNLSAHQLDSWDLAGRIEVALSRRGLDPGRLQLEITESVLAREPREAARQLRQLAQAGVSLAVDDFGTGYSSMAYLQQFPLDVLKIDRAFVTHGEDHRPELLASLIEIAASMGLRTVAEGVESTHELDEVRRLGCDVVQGYLLAHPLAAEQLGELLAARPVSVDDAV